MRKSAHFLKGQLQINLTDSLILIDMSWLPSQSDLPCMPSEQPATESSDEGRE